MTPATTEKSKIERAILEVEEVRDKLIDHGALNATGILSVSNSLCLSVQCELNAIGSIIYDSAAEIAHLNAILQRGIYGDATPVPQQQEPQ